MKLPLGILPALCLLGETPLASPARANQVEKIVALEEIPEDLDAFFDDVLTSVASEQGVELDEVSVQSLEINITVGYAFLDTSGRRRCGQRSQAQSACSSPRSYSRQTAAAAAARGSTWPSTSCNSLPTTSRRLPS
mmetsp:Transcript_50871/g.142378  ORF Transcript_50871/g.142378 Transcript_50871/m.142378 type:complete len:136 (+) Transcript_50871:116-523(+)